MNKKRKTEFDVLAYMKARTKPLPKFPKKIKLWDWLDYWSENLCISIKPTTKLSYDAAINNHIKRVFPPDLKLSDLTFEDIQLFINSLVEGVGLEESLAPKTIKNIHSVLHHSLSMAQRFKIIEDNPSNNIVLPQQNPINIIPFNVDEVKEFLHIIKGHRFETLFRFAMFSGLRQGEIIGLTWDCFDFEHNRIYVYRQMALNKERECYFAPLKNRTPRTIVIASSIMDEMKQYKENAVSNFVFPNRLNHKNLTHASVRNAFKKIVRKMGKPQFRFHDLRHTYAVLQLLAGVDPKTISENLGHYSVGFTLNVYAHSVSQMKSMGAEKLDVLYLESIKEKEDVCQ